jgi:hypothetical protein
MQGNILDHEYPFTDGRIAVATVSKRRFRVADTYGVEVPPDQNPVVILAATVALDAISHSATTLLGPVSPTRLGDPPQPGGLNREVLVTVARTPGA